MRIEESVMPFELHRTMSGFAGTFVASDSMRFSRVC